MQAIQITGYGETDKLVLKELPDPHPGPGEVAIDVKASGLNFADILCRLGLYVNAPPPPFVPGLEVAGTIAAVGPGVTDLKPGDRVVSVTFFGGYATRVVVPAIAACRLPEAVPFAEAAGMAVTGVTADHALLVAGGLRAGETVLIQAAAGGVGLHAVQMAQRVGARVIATCGGERKVRYLQEQFGLEHVIDYRREDVPTAVRRIAPAGLDVLLDSIGGAFIGTGMKLLAPNGRFVSIGGATFVSGGRRNWLHLAMEYLKTPRLHPMTLLGESKAFIGVQMLILGRDRPEVLRRALERVVAETVAGRLRTVVDAAMPADRVGEAHRLLQGRGTIGKLVITW